MSVWRWSLCFISCLNQICQLTIKSNLFEIVQFCFLIFFNCYFHIYQLIMLKPHFFKSDQWISLVFPWVVTCILIRLSNNTEERWMRRKKAATLQKIDSCMFFHLPPLSVFLLLWVVTEPDEDGHCRGCRMSSSCVRLFVLVSSWVHFLRSFCLL